MIIWSNKEKNAGTSSPNRKKKQASKRPPRKWGLIHRKGKNVKTY